MIATQKTLVSKTLYAAWLAENFPAVFNDLATRAAAAARTRPPPAMKLEGFTDILSSIGSSIGTAAKAVAGGLSTTVKSVGAFLNTDAGQGALSTVAQLYAAKKLAPSASALSELQYQRAAQGLAPVPAGVQYDPSTGTYVPVNAQGQILSLSQVRGGGVTDFLQQYGIWIAAAVGTLALFTALRRS